MRRFTSIKVGGPADSLLFPKDVEELRKVVTVRQEERDSHSDSGKGYEPGGEG